MNIPWVTVWGYGADIRATRDALTVRQNGAVQKYQLDEIAHLLIAGGHTFHTASVAHLLSKNIPVSFFDVHGKPAGRIAVPRKNPYPLQFSQKHAPPHKFAMAIITSAVKSRMLYLNELAEKDPTGLFYQGEFEILTNAADELSYLVTLQEIGRIFSLTKTMYYEILSRTVPKEFDYHRRTKPPYMDPVNAMFAHGYAVLYANFAIAAEGAGLDPSIGVLPNSQNEQKYEALIFDLMEAAKTSMVDRVVIGMVCEELMEEAYDLELRCVLSEDLMKELNRRLSVSVNDKIICENVYAYAKAIEGETECSLRF